MTLPTLRKAAQPSLLQSRRGRHLLENLTAYAFLAPAWLIIFVFGIFPVGFAFFVSLHRWRRFPEEFVGLDNYTRALGNLAYVVFFWLALGALVYGLYTLWRLAREAAADRRALTALLPGAVLTAAALTLVNWFFTLLPLVLNVPVRLRGQALSREIFIGEFLNSFSYPEVLPTANLMLFTLAVAAVVTPGWWRLLRTQHAGRWLRLALVLGLALAAGVWLLQLTLSEISIAVEEARAAGTDLPIWSQIIILSAGAGLLGFALWLWTRTVHTPDARAYVPRLLLVVLAVIGAVLLIRELIPALANADAKVLRGFNVTVMYSVFSVPLQLALGMGLAVLLFQKLRGKAFFRVIFFMPYITPFAATSVVFSLIFSHNATSPANQLMALLGVEPQRWLMEPRGIFELLFTASVPSVLVGPALALVVIILYNVWIYAGYSTVIFLAGLGGIPQDVYEAARVDGANGWQQFRHITLPLLSPTTFFMILIATIGTFQAFTQIYLMRKPGAYDAVDTINLHIFNEITRDNPNYAYGAAMAFVLFGVILALTLIQTRVVGRKVFYG